MWATSPTVGCAATRTRPWCGFPSRCRSAASAPPSFGGVYRVGQVALRYQDDTSFRAIDTSVPASGLRVTHFAYDTSDARRDPNCVLPLDPLRELVSQGPDRRAGAHRLRVYGQRLLRASGAGAPRSRVGSAHGGPGIDAALLVPSSPFWPGGQAWRRDAGGETRKPRLDTSRARRKPTGTPLRRPTAPAAPPPAAASTTDRTATGGRPTLDCPAAVGKSGTNARR